MNVASDYLEDFLTSAAERAEAKKRGLPYGPPVIFRDGVRTDEHLIPTKETVQISQQYYVDERKHWQQMRDDGENTAGYIWLALDAVASWLDTLPREPVIAAPVSGSANVAGATMLPWP